VTHLIASIGAIGIDPHFAHCRHGPIVIGRDKDRLMFRVGGWGPLLRRRRQRLRIGREAVRAALRSIDAQPHRNRRCA
jgi:N-acetylglucosamine kinase-like BadF-type ATPase